MKLDHLVARGASISVERSIEHGEKIVAVLNEDLSDDIVHHGTLPNVRVEYTNNRINTALKIKMLVDDGLPDNAEGRILEVVLYSNESLEAFFDLVDLVRGTVKGATWTAPARELSVPF
jgi:hypothetical protein